MDREAVIRMDMDEQVVGCMEWCMLDMKRLMLVDECKQEVKRVCDTAPVPDHSTGTSCKVCFSLLLTVAEEGSLLCPTCGVSQTILNSTVYTFHDSHNYNRNCRHHYTALEHFAQTLCDFTGTGNRTIPRSVYRYCLTVLGRGLSVTSAKVFHALRINGFRAYYQHKYVIANMLRGKDEFRITRTEMDDLTRLYHNYHREFMTFQTKYKIGAVSKRGKMRIYWPMRFILARLCEQIGRSDVVGFIRGIAGKSRLKAYYYYWYKLVEWMKIQCPPMDEVKQHVMTFCVLKKTISS